MTADRPATEPRPTTHTFEQVNWDNAEQETRIGALQEMVAILLNRLDEAEAASPAALDVTRAIEEISGELSHYDLSDDPGYIRVPTERVRAILRARLSRSAGEQGDGGEGTA